VTRGYSRGQIFLHWAIVLLVVLEWQTSGRVAGSLPAWLANPSLERVLAEPLPALHAAGALLLFLLVLLLIRSRRTRGPVHMGEGPAPLATLEWLTRVGLYLSLLALPLAGIAGALWRGPYESLHTRLALLLLVLVALHVGVVLWRTIALRERGILRMLRSDPPAIRQI
jgi:cytochrome b561